METEAASAKEVKEPAPSTGLGATLRSERERKGLTLEQVASVTKLRVKIVEALESERWVDLPQSVFVRGFIRSYASFLGLEGKELLHLYEQLAPAQGVSGKPEEVLHRSRKGFWLLAVVFALILGFITYRFVEHPSPPGEHPSPAGEQLVEKKRAVLESGKERRDVEAVEKKEFSPAEGAADLAAAVPPRDAERPPEVAKRAGGLTTVPAPTAETQEQTVSPDAYELKAVVLEETWVRIQVDNGGPKEYIFQPGARPQWKAKEGFHLMVGNAGGIELELNGAKLKSLGKPGKVVKLNLPASFKPTMIED